LITLTKLCTACLCQRVKNKRSDQSQRFTQCAVGVHHPVHVFYSCFIKNMPI